MSHWKATLAYDGAPYNGWQIQPNLPTVQGTLAQAIHRITGESVLPQGSGRTDTGVHALAQVATFSLTVPIPLPNLHRALNHALPPSIRVLSIEPVPETFHARHNALRKTYEYRIFPRVPYPPTISIERICPPNLAPYVWDCPYPLDFAILQNAADHIRGTHDFTSFAAVDPDLATRKNPGTPENLDLIENPGAPQPLSLSKDLDSRTWVPTAPQEPPSPTNPGAPQPALSLSKGPDSRTWVLDSATNPPTPNTSLPNPNLVISTEGGVFAAAAEKPASLPLHSPSPNTRTIQHSTWHRRDGLIVYRITGSGFLHHMVRNLVGTFVEAACRRISADDIPTILAARNRSAAGPTAPARGLFLVEVEY